jgi:mitogen-activated protein kinase kinase
MPAQRSTETFDNLRELVTELEAIRIGLPTPSKAPKEFSDDVFEELSRLGEGAGGAVHKVRHKPTGIIMARKTITTLEAPWKQLERELSIAASAKHINVVQWHGTYMSPSSSEIKILLEYCEGGSLEAVSTRIKERGAIVGEKIAGRLAEGVCNQFLKNVLNSTLLLLFVDSAGPCLPSFQEDDSPRYQTI